MWSLVDRKFISGIYETEEVAFDAVKLKEMMVQRALSSGVQIYLDTKVNNISSTINKKINVTITQDCTKVQQYTADQVFNCTYSNINIINSNSGLEVIPLKHELTEMCLIELPEEIKNLSFTVMCGPFFSIMPFPSTQYSSFSHVRNTPHFVWEDTKKSKVYHSNKILQIKHSSNWKKMMNDAKKYIPIINKCVYKRSLWETKTKLPISTRDDSRPILFKLNHGINNYHCIMGGKIDNIYDVIKVIEKYNMDK